VTVVQKQQFTKNGNMDMYCTFQACEPAV